MSVFVGRRSNFAIEVVSDGWIGSAPEHLSDVHRANPIRFARPVYTRFDRFRSDYSLTVLVRIPTENDVINLTVTAQSSAGAPLQLSGSWTGSELPLRAGALRLRWSPLQQPTKRLARQASRQPVRISVRDNERLLGDGPSTSGFSRTDRSETSSCPDEPFATSR